MWDHPQSGRNHSCKGQCKQHCSNNKQLPRRLPPLLLPPLLLLLLVLVLLVLLGLLGHRSRSSSSSNKQPLVLDLLAPSSCSSSRAMWSTLVWPSMSRCCSWGGLLRRP
jgi:hypothetical protein